MEPLQGRAQERSTSLIPLAMLFVTHLRVILAFLVSGAHCWLTVNRWSTISCWSTTNQLLINHWSTAGQLLVNHWSMISQPLVNHWSTVSQPLVTCWSTVGQPLVNHWSTRTYRYFYSLLLSSRTTKSNPLHPTPMVLGTPAAQGCAHRPGELCYAHRPLVLNLFLTPSLSIPTQLHTFPQALYLSPKSCGVPTPTLTRDVGL